MMTSDACVSSGTTGSLCKLAPTRTSTALFSSCPTSSSILSACPKWTSTSTRPATLVKGVETQRQEAKIHLKLRMVSEKDPLRCLGRSDQRIKAWRERVARKITLFCLRIGMCRGSEIDGSKWMVEIIHRRGGSCKVLWIQMPLKSGDFIHSALRISWTVSSNKDK